MKQREKRKQDSKRILLTGGRGPAVLDLARQLHQAGHELTMAESRNVYFSRFSNAIKRHVLVPNPAEDELSFIADLIYLTNKYEIEWLIPGYDEGFIIAKHRAKFPQHVRIFVEEPEMIHILHDKFRFIQLLKHLDLNAPHSVLINNAKELRAVLNSGEFQRPCIVKSIYSAGGLLARTIREDTDLNKLDIRYPCIAQKMIQGRVWSTYSIVHEGKMTFFVSYYPLHIFRENGAAICYKTEFSEGLFEVVKTLVEGTRYTGQIGFDIIEDEDGQFWPIECNPRITSGAHMGRTVDNFAECIFNRETPLKIVPDDIQVQLSRFSMLRILLQGKKLDLPNWWDHFVHSKDVIFDLRDLKPSLSIPLIGLAFFHQYWLYKKAAEENIFLNMDWED